MQGPEGRPPNVSPTRKGWEIDPEADSGAAGAAQALFFRDRPFLQQPPFPTATALSYSNRPFLQQPPFPYNYPLLFVIPSAAEGSAVPRTFPGNVFDSALSTLVYGFFSPILTI
jgi:hypothetical protein